MSVLDLLLTDCYSFTNASDTSASWRVPFIPLYFHISHVLKCDHITSQGAETYLVYLKDYECRLDDAHCHRIVNANVLLKESFIDRTNGFCNSLCNTAASFLNLSMWRLMGQDVLLISYYSKFKTFFQAFYT